MSKINAVRRRSMADQSFIQQTVWCCTQHLNQTLSGGGGGIDWGQLRVFPSDQRVRWTVGADITVTCQVATTCNKGALEQTVYVKNRVDGSFRTSSPATYGVATGEKPESVYRITWQRHSPTFTSILTGRKTDLKSKQTNCCSGSFLCTRSIWHSSHIIIIIILIIWLLLVFYSWEI